MVFFIVLGFTLICFTILIVLLVKFARKKHGVEEKVNLKLESAKRRELSLFLDGECKIKKAKSL